jgi:hypothetical protein
MLLKKENLEMPLLGIIVIVLFMMFCIVLREAKRETGG